jgi:hypothetical protein
MPQPEHRPSPEDLVAKYWPPSHYDRDALMSALITAAELISFAVHATSTGPVAAYPRLPVAVPRVTTVQEAAYYLSELAMSLSPIAERLADRLTTLTADDPTLYAADTEEAGAHTTAAAADLTRAMVLTEQLAKAFTGAFQQLGHVNHALPDVSESD